MSDKTAVNKEAKMPASEAALVPPVDVIEDANGITLYADLPGVPKDKLNLHVEADTLTIEGEVSLDLPPDMESTHAEVSLPRYRRVFSLVQGTRFGEGCRRVRAWGTETAHSESRARTATSHRSQGGVMLAVAKGDSGEAVCLL